MVRKEAVWILLRNEDSLGEWFALVVQELCCDAIGDWEHVILTTSTVKLMLVPRPFP